MGLVYRNTKTGGNTTFAAEYAAGFKTIKASEVDADFTTLYNLVNGNLESTNLASNAVATAQIQNLAVIEGKLAGAAVTEAKLAANAVTTAKILNLAVTRGKLEVNAVVNALQFQFLSTSLSTTLTTTPALLLTLPNITTRGGWVGGFASWGATLSASGADIDAILEFRRAGSPVYTISSTVLSGKQVGAPNIVFFDAPGAGTHTYTIYGSRVGATGTLNFVTASTNPGGFYVAEFS